MQRKTSHFTSKQAAIAYYRPYYGDNPCCHKDSLKKAQKYVDIMLEEGNISIGSPELLDDECVYINKDGQYVITWEEK